MKEEKVKKYSMLSNVLWVMKELFDYRKVTKVLFPLYIIFDILQRCIVVMIPAVAVASLENGGGIKKFLIQTGGIILLYTIVYIIFVYATRLYSSKGTVARVYGIMRKIIRKSITMDYGNRENNSNQKIFGVASQGVGGNWFGAEHVMKTVPTLIINFIGMIIFGGAILTIDIRILIVLVLMLVFNLVTNSYARKYLNSHMEENTEIGRKSNYLRDRIRNINCGKDIRIYGMEKWFGKVLASYVDMGQKWQKGVEQHFYLPVASDTIFTALRDGLAYVILIGQALRGELSLAEFTLMMGVVSGFSNWMFGFVGDVTDLQDANKLVSGIRECLDMEDTFLHGTGKKVSNEELINPPKIEFRDVSFWYEEDRKILSHVNLTIEKGEKIALVGGNGAGKTTLVKLLCGFYHPNEGKILVNGVSIEEYDIEEYFKLIGVVFQDIQPIEFTLLHNVSGVKVEETDMGRFHEAVKMAGISEKIDSLEQKENTYIKPVLDEKGIQLSGGESQKLMLARCLYKDAPLLILDEPTSALDPLAESEIYERYNSMTENKTSIFISHRLASTRFCDKILFLKDGEIIEQGTHEELVNMKGNYARIYEIQSHYYKEGKEMEKAYEEE